MQLKTKYPYIFVRKGLSIDDVGEGVEGPRIAGDTTESWF